MSDPESRSRARVARVIEAGRRLAEPRDPLGVLVRQRLVATSGLSPEGVDLALAEHLETHPEPRHIEALVGGTGRAPRCHVVLSANVCTAALRAIAIAAATSPVLYARPSRRDPVFLELMVQALQQDPAFRRLGGSIEIVPEVQPSAGDELHVYGSDETIRVFLERTAPGIVIRAHGTGFGIAAVGESGELAHLARAIARDVVPFDQRGCLSPRVVLVEGDRERGQAVAEGLHEALSDLGSHVPRGVLDASERAEVARYRAVIESIGQWWEGQGHAIGLDNDPRALLLPPPVRVVHIMPMPAHAAEARVGPWAEWIAAIGADDEGPLAQALFRLAPLARRSRLGEMQKPPLDGPVDLRQRHFGEPRQ